MRNVWAVGPRSVFTACAVSIVVLIGCAAAAAQAAHPAQVSSPAAELDKYPGLLPELSQLFQKVQNGVQSPAPRSQSRLLPLLPSSTVYYVAVPNYGETAQQALDIFHHEVAANAVLNKWWHSREMAEDGAKVELTIGKFIQLSQYLGDEIVVAGGPDGPDHSLVIVAQVRKPGLKDFINQNLKPWTPGSDAFKTFDLQSLATAAGDSKALAILVRPDYVVAAPGIQGLRNFNRLLDEKKPQFAATPFGEKMGEGYRNGASVMAGLNIEALLKQMPPTAAQQRQVLERTGFADAKYLVWEHKSVAGQTGSQAELSFSGPRHGIASWLAAPAPPRGLDFVSQHVVFAGTVVLKNLADVFSDVETLTAAQNPNPMASLQQMQQMLNLDLKRDLLHHFDGEITVAVESVQPDPAWMVVARVNDPEGLRQTLSKLMMTMPLAPEESEENGVHYHTLHVPSPQKTVEVAYAFFDGYMVVASSHNMASAAIARRQNGDSLPRLHEFQAALPPGHPEGVSGLLYEDPIAVAALSAGRTSPEMAGLFSQLKGKSSPVVICAYGEPNAIREATVSSGADAGAMMVVAAIAVPNLVRARMAANESSAVSNLRTINVAQLSYATAYPQKGYAHDLSSLGSDPRGSNLISAWHAGLIGAELGGAACIPNSACVKDGYSFSIHAMCGSVKCANYVALARPVSNSTGARSFCSTADGVIRVKTEAVKIDSLTVGQCRQWIPLQ